MKKINWKVRAKNPAFWVQIALAVFTPILAYFGLNWSELTTWGAIGNLLLQAIKNPVVVFSVAASVYNAIIDPTTKGLGDSTRAMTYDKPAE